jgi:4-amino-4-deoxy-L-arabinose transferase-like glycosyltransferase
VNFAGAKPLGDESGSRNALAAIAAFALARLAFAAALGPGFDESYTIVVARRLDLSYFDHPPLHQWIAHFAALALGEGAATRLPFVALFAATGWLTFALTRRLFGARAGLIALVALNLTPFFFASAGTWVVPDGPLDFALAGAAATLARLFFDAPRPRAAFGLWLAAGLWLGLAGLSKYNAVLPALGVAAFVALAPGQRAWLARPAPYLAALIAVVIVAPVFVWNVRHGWVSFAFQGARGEAAGGWRPAQVAAMAIGEIAFLSPWLAAPLVAALIDGARRAARDERRLFLVCLALPTIVVFTLTPLWGAKGLPHWSTPGWLFVYPLLGAWLAEQRAAAARLRTWTIAAAAALAAVAAVVVGQAATGFATRLIPLPSGAVDPTLETLDWGALREAPAVRSAAFVVATKWMDGGKIGLALGPAKPLFAFSDDPRGLAFLSDSADFIGRDAAIVVAWDRREAAEARLAPYFAGFDAPQHVTLQRGGRDEIALAVIPAHGLTRAFPLPYRR